MDAELSFQADGGNKVVLPGMPGSISNGLTLENEHGNVVVTNIHKDYPVLKNLGLSKGDELIGATIYFDNLKKDEVINILKATEPYKTGLKLHVKNEAKSPASPLSGHTFNLQPVDLGMQSSAYEDIFNNKIKRHLKAAKSMENLSDTSPKAAHMKATARKIQGEFRGLAVNTNGPTVSAKAPRFQVPSMEIPAIGLSGRSTETRNVNVDGKMKMPDIDISVPTVNSDFKNSALKSDLPKLKGDDLTFKMPSSNLSDIKTSPYGVDLNVKGPELKGDGDVASPKLKGYFSSPDLDIRASSVHNVASGKGHNLPQFQTPTFGVSGPNIKTPDLDLDGYIKGPEMDASVPKIKGKVKGPEVNVELPDADIAAPKMKMPSVNIPQAKMSVSDDDLHMKAPELRGNIDISDPKLEADIKGPNRVIDTPNISLKGSDKKMNSPQFKMPSFGMSAPSIKPPELNSDNKSPELDVSLPKVEGDFKYPTKKGGLPNVDVKGPHFKMPSTDIINTKTGLPVVDLNVKSPDMKGEFDITAPKVQTKVEGPGLDISAPNVNLKGSEKKVNLPEFKMPSFGISGPSVKAPDLDGNIKMPSLDVALPKVKGDFKVPAAKVDLPNVDVKGPNFKMPTLGTSNIKTGIPDIDLNMKAPAMKGDIDIPSPKLQSNIEGPDVEINAPNISLKGPEKKMNLPQFKMPSFGISGPSVKAPELDGNINMPSLDVSLPKVEGDFKVPAAKVDLPNVDVKGPKFKVPTLGTSNIKTGINDIDLNMTAPEMKGDIDIPSPKLQSNIEGPDVDINAPNISLKGPEKKINLPQFKMPSHGMSGPSMKTPDIEVDGEMKRPELDVSVPKVKGKFKGPEFNVDLPAADITAPKMKMPSINIPSGNLSLHEGDLNVKAPELKGNVDIKDPKFKGEVKAPKVDMKAPNISLKSPDKKGSFSHFKMPSYKKSGSTIKSPELDVSLPKVEGEINGPTAKLDQSNVDEKGPRFKMPSLKIFQTKVGLPDADLSLKSPDIKGGVDIPSPKLKDNLKSLSLNNKVKTSIEGPDLEINQPNISSKGYQTKTNTAHFKIPSFGISEPHLQTPHLDIDGKIKKADIGLSAPKIKGPDISLDLPKAEMKGPNFKMPSLDIFNTKTGLPDVDLNVKSPKVKGDFDITTPKVQTKIEGPDLDINAPNVKLKGYEKKVNLPEFKMPSFGMSGPSIKSPELDSNIKTPSLDVSLPKIEGELKVPAANIDLPNADVKGPKFKMSSLGIFNTITGVPDADLNVNAPEMEGDIDIASPKLQTNVKGPDVDINAPHLSLKGPEKKMNLPQFKMPSFGMSGPSMKTPDIEVDGKMKRPEIDVSVPNVKGKFKGPEVNVDLPDGDITAPKVKMPSINIPSGNLSLHEGDLNVKAPELKGNIDMKDPTLKGDIRVPNLDIEAPNVNVKGSEKKVSLPHFKMPSFGKSPSIDVSVPKVEGDLKIPAAKVDLPNVDAKGPTFKMPSLKMFQRKTDIPDVDLNVKAPEIKGDFDITSPKLKTNIEGPDIDINAPNISLAGPERKMNLPQFKMPSFGMSGPSMKAPDIEVDGKMKRPEMDVSVPKMKSKFKCPDVNVDLPAADITSLKMKMPSINIPSVNLSLPAENLNVRAPELKGNIDIKDPKLKGDINVPNLDIKAPNVNLKGSEKKGFSPHFKMPSFGMSGPNVKTPQVDGNIKSSALDPSLPKVEGGFKGPAANMDLPNEDVKGQTFKMPSLDMFNTKIGIPDVDLNVKSPEVKGDFDITAPKLQTKVDGSGLDINAPNINLKGSEKKVNLPEFKMPSFGISGPSIKSPELDSNLKIPSLDVSLPKVEGDFKGPAAKVDLANADAKGPTFKMPSLKMFQQKTGIPDVDLNVKAPELKHNIDITTPKLKGNFKAPALDSRAPNINLKTDLELDSKMKTPDIGVSAPKLKGPEINMDLPKADIKASKFKMPSLKFFQKKGIPDVDLSLKSPELRGDVDINTPKLQSNFKGPELDVNPPNINLKTSEKKINLPHFKMPSFGISGPSINTPDLEEDVKIKARDIGVSLPKAKGTFKGPYVNVDLPSADITAPKMKMPSLDISPDKYTAPDVDLNVKTPKLNVNGGISDPKLEGKIEGPKLDINVPNINLANPDTNRNLPKFKIPSFGMLGPSIKTSDVEVSLPKVEGKLESPAANADLPNIDVKGTNVEMVLPDISQRKGVPEMNLNVNAPDIKVNSDVMNPKLKTDNDGPSINMNAPSVSLKRSEKNMNLPEFTMPSFGMSGPSTETQNLKVDGNMIAHDVDVSLPKVKNTLRSPEINLDQPNVDFKAPTMKTPSINISPGKPLNMDVSISSDKISQKKKMLVPDIDLNLEAPDGTIDLSSPKLKGHQKSPNVDVNAQKESPTISGKKVTGPQFKFPSFGFSGPSMQTPEVKLDSNIKRDDVGISVPNVEGKVKSPTINIDLPNVSVKDTELKMPTFQGVQTKSHHPDAELNLGSSNLECDINTNVDLPETNLKVSEKKGSLSWFKMPTFGKSKPSVQTSDIDFDDKMTRPKGDSSPSKFKKSFFGTSESEPGKKRYDLAIDTDTSGPKVVNNSEGLSRHLDQESTDHKDAKVKTPKLKEPGVNLGAQIKTPEIGVSLAETKNKFPTTEINLDSPKETLNPSLTNTKAKGSPAKLPFAFSEPNFSFPEIDFGFSAPKLSTT